MDDVDRAILDRLRRDARTTNATIGAELGLSEGAIRHRVARMVADGTVLKFTVITRPLGPEGLVLVRCAPGATRSVVERIRREAVDLFETSGDFDLGASVEAPTMAEFNEALDRIRGLAGVESTTTLVRLTRYVHPATAEPTGAPSGNAGPPATARARGSAGGARRPSRSRSSDG